MKRHFREKGYPKNLLKNTHTTEKRVKLPVSRLQEARPIEKRKKYTTAQLLYRAPFQAVLPPKFGYSTALVSPHFSGRKILMRGT